MNSTVVSIRLNKGEYDILSEAAKFNGLSLPKYLKNAARRDAEDAIDVAIAENILVNDKTAKYTTDDLRKEFLGE